MWQFLNSYHVRKLALGGNCSADNRVDLTRIFAQPIGEQATKNQLKFTDLDIKNDLNLIIIIKLFHFTERRRMYRMLRIVELVRADCFVYPDSDSLIYTKAGRCVTQLVGMLILIQLTARTQILFQRTSCPPYNPNRGTQLDKLIIKFRFQLQCLVASGLIDFWG